MTGTAVATAVAIDCDVHCVLPAIDVLSPYLGDHWPGYIEAAGFVGSPSLKTAYPAGAATTAGKAARAALPVPGTDLETLRAHVLDRWDACIAVLVCMTGFEAQRNLYFSAALCRAANEWMAAEWLDRDPRLRGSLVVPTLDPAAAAEEIERWAGDPRWVQVLLPVRSEAPYGNKRYLPILEAASRNGLAVVLHAWGSAGSAPTPSGFPERYMEDYVTNQEVVQSQLTSLAAEGVFDRLEDLRVLIGECGFTWLPSLLWRLDKDWKGIRREIPWVATRPSDSIRRQVRATIAPTHGGPDIADAWRLAEMIGSDDFLVYASDYPHDHGPHSQALLDFMPAADKERVLWRNAASFLNLAPQTSESV